ncbi:MAG: hypothetical protein CMC07_07070 [Flavobacteriaceae bacterium]|nr:hypothetical protein [Flavobacteriaceae bacterium]|tara:strand:- start:9656 stop:11008 length:1353 start_codon:yes stop_codon:yes gene_type:complete
METNLLPTKFQFSLILTMMLHITYAQVGIGTVTPDPSSLLQVDDANGNKGMLIPSVALTATNLSAPITPAPATSLLVYNTATSGTGNTAVSPGYYYWDGSKWVNLKDSDKWDLLGNSGTNANLNFLGTTDANAVTFRTNNVQRFRIANGNQVFAMEDGNNNAPFYSWNDDTNVGIWRPGNDQLALSAGNSEFLRIREAGTDQLIINEQGGSIDTRVESNNNENMLFVDGAADRIGVKTNTPQTELHIAGNTSTVRIEELNEPNNAHNVAADPAPVYADNNGNLTLQPPLVQSFMPINEINFIPSGISVQSSTGEGLFTDLYSTTITLTQESLVHVTYHFSIQLTRANGIDPIVDGASRLYRSWIEVNGDPNYIAFDTGTYTNNPDVESPGGTYASGYYYLAGSGYAQLPAGTHTIDLRALTFAGGNGGAFDYRVIFGETSMDRIQLVVHR